LFYFENGFLHRESGPAVENIYDHENDEWVLWGTRVSEKEVENYDPARRAIEFKNDDGQLHRDVGPAVISFEDNSSITEYYYNNGISTHSIKNAGRNAKFARNTVPKAFKVTRKKPKVVKVTNKESTNPYTELSSDELAALRAIFKEHLPEIEEFREEISEAARQVRASKGLDQEKVVKDDIKEESEEMTTTTTTTSLESRKKIRSGPDLTGNRRDQVWDGFKFGFKKQVANNSSYIFAEKVTNLTPLEGNEWFERFLQICLLLGVAEALQRMPEGMAEKLRLEEDLRRDAASMFRYLSGENIGRDIIDVAANVLPLFAEVLKDFSAEEIKDLKQDLEIEDEDEDEERVVEEVNDLFVNEEEKKIYEEVAAR
jgi:hypothetical protein